MALDIRLRTDKDSYVFSEDREMRVEIVLTAQDRDEKVKELILEYGPKIHSSETFVLQDFMKKTLLQDTEIPMGHQEVLNAVIPI